MKLKRLNTVFSLIFLSLAVLTLAYASVAEAEPLGVVKQIRFVDTAGIFNESNISFSLLGTKVGQVADSTVIEQDMQALYNTGYFSKVAAYVEPQDDGVVVIFEVQGYPVLKDIVFEGVSPERSRKLLSIMKLQVGHVFNRKVLMDDTQRINQWFAENGFPAGRMVSYHLSSNGVLRLVADEGIVGNVRVVTKREDGEVERSNLLRYVDMASGEVLTDERLQHGVERLVKAPGVKSVDDVLLSRDRETGRTNVTFVVQDAPTGRYEIGVGYNTSDGFLAYGNISKDRLFDTERSITASFRVTQRNNVFDIKYSDAEICSTCWDRWNLNIYRRYGLFGHNKDYKETVVGLSTSIDKTIAPNTVATVGTTLNFVDNGVVNRRLVTLDGGLRYDVESFALNGELNYAIPALGSEYQYLRAQVATSTKHDIGPGTLSASLRLGTLSGTTIPEFAYFRVGGPGTLRGYPFGWRHGGKLLAGTIEYVIPVWNIVGVAGFVDVADAVNAGEKMNLHTSAGVGVRVDTPIGLLKLDYATGENGQMRFVFGVGAEL